MALVSSREEKEVVLQGKKGEQKFILTQFDAFAGLAYQRKLVKILAPSFLALQEVMDNKPTSTATENTSGSAVAAALSKLVDNLDQVEPAFIKELIVKGAQKEGRVAINFDNDFAGNYGVMFQLVKEIVMFNFEDLFQMLGSN